MSQLVLLPFRCFTYVTSSSLNSPGELPMPVSDMLSHETLLANKWVAECNRVSPRREKQSIVQVTDIQDGCAHSSVHYSPLPHPCLSSNRKYNCKAPITIVPLCKWVAQWFICLKLWANVNAERRGTLLWTGRKSNCFYRFTQIPLLSLECCLDFETRKLACNVTLILHKLHRT